MPTRHSKFTVNPEYDEEKEFANAIKRTRDFLNNELLAVDKIEDETLQLICIFSLIDRLAQEQAGYPSRGFQEVFCQFVLKHQKQCEYMECVEPVTLYYRVEDLIEEVVLVSNLPPEKEISLEPLGYLSAVPIKDVLSKNKSQEILDYIKKKKGEEFAAQKAKEHQLISLLYRMRSKAVHEMSGLGEGGCLHNEFSPKVPYYMNVDRAYVKEGYWFYDDVDELIIPNIFIRNILADCIEGYLSDCIKNKRLPFSNNHMTRKYNLSWYDK